MVGTTTANLVVGASAEIAAMAPRATTVLPAPV